MYIIKKGSIEKRNGPCELDRTVLVEVLEEKEKGVMAIGP
jgi:hypothetical protein